MMRPVQILRLLICGLLVGYAANALGAQLRIDNAALEKLLKTRLFREGGKWHLVKGDSCNNPYLENPSTAIRQGRISIKVHFAGRLGTKVWGNCVSIGEPSWIEVSGKPAVKGRVLFLDEVKVDRVEKDAVRALATPLLESALRSLARVDLDQYVGPLIAPDKTSPYFADLTSLTLRVVEADRNRLVISIDFDATVR